MNEKEYAFPGLACTSTAVPPAGTHFSPFPFTNDKILVKATSHVTYPENVFEKRSVPIVHAEHYARGKQANDWAVSLICVSIRVPQYASSQESANGPWCKNAWSTGNFEEYGFTPASYDTKRFAERFKRIAVEISSKAVWQLWMKILAETAPRWISGIIVRDDEHMLICGAKKNKKTYIQGAKHFLAA